MEIIEFYRARTALFWHLGILAVIAFLVLMLGHQASVDVVGPGGTSHLASGNVLPLVALAPISAFYAAIFGSTLGTSLNRENATREISWTKPLSRTAIATRFILIDLVAVLVVFAITFAVLLFVLQWLRIPTIVDDTLGPITILGLGMSAMWYALVQALTFWLPPGGRSVGGVLWPVALALAGVAHLDGPLGRIATVLDIFNPLAYMSGVNHTLNGTTETAVFQAPIELRLFGVWFLSAAFCAIAIALWPKKEA